MLGTEREAELDGLAVRYRLAGDPADPPVVLLHGGGLDAATLSWRETIPALADDFAVYALDWPGYGGSDPPEETPTIRYYVSVLRRFLDALELDSVRLVGISMGGGAALGFALDFPERVERLVLVDSYGLGGSSPGGSLGAMFVRLPVFAGGIWDSMAHSRDLTELALRNLVANGNLTDELVDDAWTEVRRPNAGSAWTAFQRAEVGFDGLKTNYADRLAELAVPTLFVHGEADRLVPVSWAVSAGAEAPDAEVEVLENCGHLPPRERPEAFLASVEAFLAG